LENAIVHAATLRMRGFYCHCYTSGRHRTFSHAHNGANQQQAYQTPYHAAESRHQRKDDDSRDQYFATSDAVGQKTHGKGRYTPEDGKNTNQIAEITAAIEGLSRIPEGAAVELVSDSQYVLKGLSEWRAGWERKGWRNSKNEPVANLELWKRLFAVADARKVSTRWVRGHNGDVLNERADALANAALAHAARRAGPER
jgi:ribonuclease HI